MTEHSFSLIPFSDSNIPDIQITGRVSRKKNLLEVHFLLTGEINRIIFPEVTAPPQRRDDLWKTTCFEFFLAVADEPGYWEFNMSPSGDWNVYRMDAYRQVGLREETSIQSLHFSVKDVNKDILVETAVDLKPLIQEDQQIQTQVTSVIEDKNGHESYWALTHPGLQADFHRREGFVLLLKPTS